MLARYTETPPIKGAELLYREATILTRIEEIARAVGHDYRHGTRPLCLVPVLRGGGFFGHQLFHTLAKMIPRPPLLLIDPIEVSRYGLGFRSDGRARIIKGLTLPRVEMDILLVEDMTDDGGTLARLVKYAGQRKFGAASVRTAALVYRDRGERPHLDYPALPIPGTHWAVGCGLDVFELFREQADIWLIDQKNLPQWLLDWRDLLIAQRAA